MKSLRWIGLLIAVVAVGQQTEETFRFSTTTQLVVVDVEVRDRDGHPIEGLTAEDFELLEDGRPQKIAIFEYQRLRGTAGIDAAPGAAASDVPPKQGVITGSKPGQIRYRDSRLMVLFFDLSSMPTEDQIRARKAAEKFVQENLSPTDWVAVMTFGNQLRVLEDFTNDRDRLLTVIDGLRIGEASELAEELAAGEEETGEDTGAAFTADETEFNIFNTDRKLTALETATKMLASLPEKKALVYFSSGVGRTGVENQSQLRATINSAVKSNVSFYPIDARGLVAEAPLGDSRRGGSRGSSMYSGQAQRQRRDRFLNQQETLYTLAEDTGGKAFLDSNDLSRGIVEAKEDIASYYILGYYPTNMAEDGRYRRIKVRLVSNTRAKLDYRSGYFAQKSFKDFDADDRERQLEEALALGDPITDLRLALEVNYFRRGRDRYIVPVAVKVPGSEIELARRRDREEARLDFIGQVRNKRGSVMGVVRDYITVKLKGKEAEKMKGRHLQYDSAFTLPPGEYSLKFLVRENETGKMGTFETSFEVPDISGEDSYLRLSSVVWSNQREALESAVGQARNNRRSREGHPFIKDGRKLIPSITRVFRRDQDLFVYFEAYDPGRKRNTDASVTSAVSFYRGGVKVFESDPLQLRSGEGRRNAGTLAAEFQIPLETLTGGEYICQVSVVDEVGRKFAFQRAPMVVLP